jgi:hypothetical protein
MMMNFNPPSFVIWICNACVPSVGLVRLLPTVAPRRGLPSLACLFAHSLTRSLTLSTVASSK